MNRLYAHDILFGSQGHGLPLLFTLTGSGSFSITAGWLEVIYELPAYYPSRFVRSPSITNFRRTFTAIPRSRPDWRAHCSTWFRQNLGRRQVSFRGRGSLAMPDPRLR